MGLNKLTDTIRSKYPGQYDDLDDATLTKKVLDKYPEYSDMAAPGVSSVPRPQLPGELQPSTPFERIGERIQQNLYAIPNALEGHTATYQSGLTSPKAIAEAQQERQAQNSETKKSLLPGPPTALGTVKNAVTMAPRMLWNQAQQYKKDPSALAGDIITALPELAEHGLPQSKGTGTGSGSALKGESAPSAQLPVEKLSPEQHQAWSAKVDAAEKEFSQKSKEFHEGIAQQARKAEIQQDIQGSVEKVRQAAQQLHADRRFALDQGWNELRNEIGSETPTPTKRTIQSIMDAQKELRGAPEQLKQFKNLLGELGLEGMIVDDTGQIATKGQGIPGAPAPWQTLRTHSTAIGSAMSGDIPGNIKRALGTVKDGIEMDLAETARSLGYGREYEALKDTEHQFRKDFEDTGAISQGKGNPLGRIVLAPNGEFAQPHILGKAGDLLVGALDRWDPTGGLSREVKRLQQIHEEGKGIKPKTLNPPQMKDVPMPTPKVAPEEGTTLSKPERFLSKVGGKMVGGTLGSAIGHPFLGYAIGGELGPEMLKKIKGRGAVPPPPPPPSPRK